MYGPDARCRCDFHTTLLCVIHLPRCCGPQDIEGALNLHAIAQRRASASASKGSAAGGRQETAPLRAPAGP